ncbi:hypothetical protein ABZ635_26085 [Nocardiopsis sp. NPDC007018]|uniref:hypothetical protein n=1 Tax=Nocardiopsis sp. NPDC007018 TaxID=3155721 RepID=UPI0033F41942
MAPRLVDTLPGELRLDIDIVGTGGDRLVLGMSGPLEEVRAQLDTLRNSLAQASTVLEAREFMVREFGADSHGGLR